MWYVGKIVATGGRSSPRYSYIQPGYTPALASPRYAALIILGDRDMALTGFQGVDAVSKSITPGLQGEDTVLISLRALGNHDTAL